MSPAADEVRLELLLPGEIRAAIDRCSLVYLPLGTYEWHGEHLPIGLDGLTAHGVCLEAARQEGGLVAPALYYGTGGGHGHYPWTIIPAGGDEIAGLLRFTLERLEAFGVGRAVLFSGHFAGEQVAMIEDLAAQWNAGGHRLQAVAAAINLPIRHEIAPDHAALFETTLLHAFFPDRVQVERLPPLTSVPSPDPGGDVWGRQRHGPEHPLYGIFGPDPRGFDPSRSQQLLQAVVEALLLRVHPHNL